MNTTHRLSPVFFLILSLCCLAIPNRSRAADKDDPFPSAAPETTGLSPEALLQLSEVVDGYLSEGQIVGAELLVIKNRRTVLHKAFGLRDREREIPMTPNSIFNIRSMTKPITGAAVQMLIDRGKLRLSDRASRYLPGFDNEKSKDITIEQLLTHRSGLPVTVLTSINQYKDLQSMANAIGERGPQFSPDSKFWYSDPGTDVLGAIVETVSGMSLEAFWKENLLGPLGMKDSFVPLDKKDPRWNRLATGYIGRPGEWTEFWTPTAEPLYPFAWGSQTIYGTTMDYARFLALFLDKGVTGNLRLLSEEAVSRTLTPASRMTGMGTDAKAPTGFPNLETHYGQMAVLYVDSNGKKSSRATVFGHSGSDGTWAWGFPDEDLIVLYFTQSRGGASGLGLERWIDELLVHPDQASTARPQPTKEQYDEIVGEYLADFGSLRNTTLKIRVTNNRASLDLGRGVIELRNPDDEGKWYFAITNSTSVSFTRNNDGIIDAMRMHESGWDFEAPRKGVPIAPEIDESKLQKYVGTYHVKELNGEINVILHNHRLALDKSSLPGRRPADLFELLPPGDDGRWTYRINNKMSAAFDEADDGSISGLRILQAGNRIARGKRVAESTAQLPSVEDIMALRKTKENTKILAGIGGVVMKGNVILEQSGLKGKSTVTSSGTDCYRFELKLDQGTILEIANADGASTHYFSQKLVHEGKYLKQARNGHPLLQYLDWRERNETVEVIAKKTWRGRDVFVLRTIDGDAPHVLYHLDATTGDVLKNETTHLAPTGDVSVRTTFEDFRVVGGLRFPYKITVNTPMNGDVVQEFEEIKVHQEVSPELFTP